MSLVCVVISLAPAEVSFRKCSWMESYCHNKDQMVLLQSNSPSKRSILLSTIFKAPCSTTWKTVLLKEHSIFQIYIFSWPNCKAYYGSWSIKVPAGFSKSDDSTWQPPRLHHKIYDLVQELNENSFSYNLKIEIEHILPGHSLIQWIHSLEIK